MFTNDLPEEKSREAIRECETRRFFDKDEATAVGPAGYTIGTSLNLSGNSGAMRRANPPVDAAAVVEFATLIRRDFEDYIQDVQLYFQCLDKERGRAFEEARKVSQEYGVFLQRAGDD